MAALDAVIADLPAFGPIIHETEVSTFEVEALGTHVDLVQLCAGVTAARRTRVRGALRAGCRRLTMNGRMVEILVGHATFCGLAQRVVLAIFDAVYKFIQVAGDTRIPLWETVRVEMRAFAGLMIFLRGRWCHQWSGTVTSFDASLTGWGVTEAFFPREMIGRIGRVPERSRFRRLPLSETARAHALGGANDFVWDIEHEAFVRAFRGEAGEFEQMWASARDFVEIPVDMRHKPDWSPVRWGRWGRAEHITLLEARTAVRAVQHRLQRAAGCHCRMLFLGDNLGCILALSRSWAKDYSMLVQVRRAARGALRAAFASRSVGYRANGTPPTTPAVWLNQR